MGIRLKYIVFSTLLLLLFTDSLFAQTCNPCYAIVNNGNWNSAASWSNTPGGAPTTNIPSNTDTVYIGESGTININAAADFRVVKLVVHNGGSVTYTSGGVDFRLNNGGSILVEDGGLIDGASQNNARIRILGSSNSTITCEGTGNRITGMNRLQINNSGTTTISGSGDITLENQFRINASGTVNYTGSGTISCVNFIINQPNATFTNSGTVNASNEFRLYQNGTTVTNNGTISVSDDMKSNSNDDDNQVINNTGTLTVSNRFDCRNADWTFNNTGTINQSSNWRRVGSGTQIVNNQNGGTWNTSAANFTGVTVNASTASNVFVFNGTTAQDIFSPNDGSYYNLTIAGSNTKALEADVTVDNDFDLGGAATLDMSTNTANLNVGGDYSNSGGSLTQGDQIITLNGSSNQSITGTNTIGNLTLNNASGATISSGSVSMTKTLLLTNGTLTTNGLLTISSDATATGSIGEITGGSISGNVTLQRYFNKSANGYVHLATSMNSMTIQDWNDDIWTTGFTGSDVPSNPFVNVYTYDETTLGDLDQGWTAATNITNSVNPGDGFLVYVTPGATTLDVTGTINTGAHDFGVTYTDDPGQPATDDGWNLIGNPYPSTIDWDAGGWTKTNVNNAIYVYDDDIDQYTSYVGGVGANGGSQYISSTQSFWVQTNGASPSLIIQESCKSSKDTSFFRSASKKILKLQIAGTNGLKDETVLRLDSASSLNFETDVDALKFASWNWAAPYISTKGVSGEEFSINTFERSAGGNIVDMDIKVGVNGTYTINLIENLMGEDTVLLEDLVTGSFTDLNSTSSYSFTANTTDPTARFKIHIGTTPPNALPIELISFAASPNNKAIDLNWVTGSEINNDYFTIEKSHNGRDFQELERVKGAGNSNEKLSYYNVDRHPFEGVNYYRLKQTDFDGKFSYSQVVAVNMQNSIQKEEFTVWPNPANGDYIGIQANGLSENSIIQITISNVIGKHYSYEVSTDDNGFLSHELDLPTNLAPGAYIITINDSDNINNQKLVIE